MLSTVLHCMGGISLAHRQVAEVMGISEETAKMRLHRARVSLRNALAGYLQRAQPWERKEHV